ncbi:hypothetical protein HYX14_00225 [Candidatus Woesearchaeota archaeon]|nr:hypothetical protein [Candidatus Woesearchaeota archaeon]
MMQILSPKEVEEERCRLLGVSSLSDVVQSKIPASELELALNQMAVGKSPYHCFHYANVKAGINAENYVEEMIEYEDLVISYDKIRQYLLLNLDSPSRKITVKSLSDHIFSVALPLNPDSCSRDSNIVIVSLDLRWNMLQIELPWSLDFERSEIEVKDNKADCDAKNPFHYMPHETTAYRLR